MAPNLKLAKNLDEEIIKSKNEKIDNIKECDFKVQIVWKNVLLMSLLHLSAIYGNYLMFTSAMWQTNILAIALYIISGLGITAGVHRLWTHRCYKAKLPLRVLLMFLNSMAFQNDIYEWSRDHRVHHKYSETDADPHNSNRGFFFSHIGWLLCRKHPDVIKKGKFLDLSDILADPVVRFQKRYYLILVLFFCFYLPTWLPVYLWGETWYNGFYICAIWRYCFTLNMTWLVNSAAHVLGKKPYDKRIAAAECIPTIIGANGEGFHNYHHTFPWDYAASELGTKFNITTLFIDFCAMLGLAYDRKTASKVMIRDRKIHTGDRPHSTDYRFFY